MEIRWSSDRHRERRHTYSLDLVVAGLIPMTQPNSPYPVPAGSAPQWTSMVKSSPVGKGMVDMNDPGSGSVVRLFTRPTGGWVDTSSSIELIVPGFTDRSAEGEGCRSMETLS